MFVVVNRDVTASAVDPGDYRVVADAASAGDFDGVKRVLLVVDDDRVDYGVAVPSALVSFTASGAGSRVGYSRHS